MMRDCDDGMMRDQLPLWVHGALLGDEAAAVAAHVAGCEACANEVVLIRHVAAAFPVPAPDVTRIAAVVPTVGEVRARATWVRRQRFAAAASILIVASIGLATVRSAMRASGDAADPMQFAVQAEPAMPAVVPAESVTFTLDEPAGGTVPGFPSVSQLSDDQLRELLTDLQRIEALPSAEPATTNHLYVHDTTEDDL